MSERALKPDITTWDTRNVPSRQTFSYFRDAICSVYMPWTAEIKRGSEFYGRGTSAALDNGIIGKLRSSEFRCSRSKSDIAASPHDYVYANVVVAGELKVEQGGKERFANVGDLILIDGSEYVNSITGPSDYELLALLIPKKNLQKYRSVDFRKLDAVKASEMFGPLKGCLDFLGRDLTRAPKDDLSAVLDACVSLLSVAVSQSFDDRPFGAVKTPSRLGKIFRLIDSNIADQSLSPTTVAREFGITPRYLHKLFAMHGTTFGTYLLDRRLDAICQDLSSAPRHMPIAEIASRWGFIDLSTFYRAFRRRRGCSPSAFRNSGG